MCGEIFTMIEFESTNYGKFQSHNRMVGTPQEVLGNSYKCPTCQFRMLGLYTKKCKECIFIKGEKYPNYKFDIKLANSKLDFFTIEKYPQYSGCFGQCDPESEKCVPNCKVFQECFNKSQKV